VARSAAPLPLLLDARAWHRLHARAWHRLLARRIALCTLWWIAAVREAVSRLLPVFGIGGDWLASGSRGAICAIRVA
jgi:hypothetical protein